MHQHGLTTLDILALLICVVMAVLVVGKIDDVLQTHSRFACYENQQALDKILWNTNNVHKREIWDVISAYTIDYHGAAPPVMVVLYKSRLSASGNEVRVVNLAATRPTPDITCPLDKAEHHEPVINYWFMGGRWRCLFNRYHSE